MIELLEQYSILEIITFIVIIALAMKSVLTFCDWLKDRIFKFVKKEQKTTSIEDQIKSILISQKELYQQIEQINGTIQILVKSDKDDIKSFITKEYHNFTIQGWIDDYSLDCIEKRFEHYKDEGGNSFIEQLMKEIRKLPHQPPK